MSDIELMKKIATGLFTSSQISVPGQTLRVRRTSSHRLRNVRFLMNGREYEAIEQNPDKPSRWGKLAREGHQVVQFRDLQTNRYVAVAVDGDVLEYGRMGRKDKDYKDIGG